jgi:hypothetical protein
MARVAVAALAVLAVLPAEARFDNLQGRIDYDGSSIRAVTAPSVFDQTLSFGSKVVPAAGLNGTSVTFGGSCGVAYKSLPFALLCKPELTLVLPDNAKGLLENTGPILFGASAGLVLGRDAVNTESMALDFQFAARTPDLDFNTGWLDAFGFTGKVAGVAVPPVGASSITLLQVAVPDLANEICLLQLMPTLVKTFPQYGALAATLKTFSATTGTDICAKISGLNFDQKGAQLKMLIALHALDETKMTALSGPAKNAVITLRNTLLKRNSSIIIQVDVGQLLFGQKRAPGDLSPVHEVLDENGTFSFGGRARLPTPRPTPQPTVLPTSASNLDVPVSGNALSSAPAPSGSVSGAVIAGGAGVVALVALVAVGSALFVRRRQQQRAASSTQLATAL